MMKVKFINILLLFFVFVANKSLFSQTVIFIEQDESVYSDTTSTPAVNVSTGKLMRSIDAKISDEQNKYPPAEKKSLEYFDLFGVKRNENLIEPKNNSNNEK